MEPLYQANLEIGYPTPKSAVKYLDFVIASVRARNGKVIKAWHGNEETESHGTIKEPVRAFLRKLKRQGKSTFLYVAKTTTKKMRRAGISSTAILSPKRTIRIGGRGTTPTL